MTTSIKWCYGLAFLLVFAALMRVITNAVQPLNFGVAAIIISLFIVFTRVMELEVRFNIHLSDVREKEKREKE
jgi:membrane protein YdbS with pleckstrin-like domain